MIVDPHHHLWRFSTVVEQHTAWRTPAYQRIAHDFEPDDLSAEIASAGVDHTVAVQAVDTAEENDRLLEYARTVPFLAGVVAWLPLSDQRAAETELQRWEGASAVRGVRQLIGHDPAEWLLDEGTLTVLRELATRGLSWDVVVVSPEQASHVLRVAEAVPQLRIVVDHLGRPPVDSGGWQPWAEWIRRFGEQPNIAVKVSVGIDVLTAWPQWAGRALDRYIGWVAEHVGPARMMLASNWPVVLLRNGYAETLTSLQDSLSSAGLSAAELEQVRADTAKRWYALATDTTAAS